MSLNVLLYDVVCHESRTYTRRKRRISSESRESFSSDVESQCSALCHIWLVLAVTHSH